jgi:hypothetical protein
MKSKIILLAALLAAAGGAQAQPAPAQQPASAVAASSPAKKELVQRLLTLRQGAIEGMSRGIVERPLVPLMQRAGNTLQTQVPAEKREALGKSMEADIRQFLDDAVPLLRERALKIAPSTYGSALEEKFTEDELRQFVAWLESPASKKFQQLDPDMQTAFVQKLAAEANSLLGPKLQALEQKLSATLGAASAAGGASRPAASKPKAAK